MDDKKEEARKARRLGEKLRRWKLNQAALVSRERFLRNRKVQLVSNRRYMARKAGLEFTITADSLSWPEFCPVLGIKLDYLTRGKIKPNLPTIDRVDTRYGYHDWNSRIISFRANTKKNTLSVSELTLILSYINRVRDEASEKAALNQIQVKQPQ